MPSVSNVDGLTAHLPTSIEVRAITETTDKFHS